MMEPKDLIQAFMENSIVLVKNQDEYNKLQAEYVKVVSDLEHIVNSLLVELHQVNPKLTRTQLLQAYTLVNQSFTLLQKKPDSQAIFDELKKMVVDLPEMSEESDKIMTQPSVSFTKKAILN